MLGRRGGLGGPGGGGRGRGAAGGGAHGRRQQGLGQRRGGPFYGIYLLPDNTFSLYEMMLFPFLFLWG